MQGLKIRTCGLDGQNAPPEQSESEPKSPDYFVSGENKACGEPSEWFSLVSNQQKSFWNLGWCWVRGKKVDFVFHFSPFFLEKQQCKLCPNYGKRPAKSASMFQRSLFLPPWAAAFVGCSSPSVESTPGWTSCSAPTDCPWFLALPAHRETITVKNVPFWTPSTSAEGNFLQVR